MKNGKTFYLELAHLTLLAMSLGGERQLGRVFEKADGDFVKVYLETDPAMIGWS